MAQITIDIPDDLAQRLQQFQAQLPRVLELGLQELETQQQSANFLDEQDIIILLASQSTPEGASTGWGSRVSGLMSGLQIGGQSVG